MNQIWIETTARQVFAGGHEFEGGGTYERVDGRAHFAVAPGADPQSTVVDLALAPVNADGLVEFSAEICILKPVDAGRGNRRLYFGYGNRGNKRELQFFNDAPASNAPRSLEDAGNGFLMRRGYTVVWGAWQGDLLPGDGRMVMELPVATDNGQPLEGPVRTEFVLDEAGTQCLPLSGKASTRSHPTISLDPEDASLTRRRYSGDAREPVPASRWAFARVERGMGLDAQGAERAIVASDRHIYLEEGFEPGWIYELVYTGRDPLVLGLGHVAVRDLVSFLRYETTDAAGNSNPVGLPDAPVEKAYAWGRSQTGRCIRDFVHLGFNVDSRGRRVFDGVLPHVSGAGLMWMNHRFANVVCPAGQQHEDHYNCADRFPFSYARSTDHVTGKTDAILKRPATDPLVLHTQTATEYWQRRGSLVHTDTEGNDLAQPDTVRIFLWASSQHFADPNLQRPSRGSCQHYVNIVSTSMLFRTMLDAMDAWATDGTAPPESQIPTRADGTLVAYEDWRSSFPAIPGLSLPSGASQLPGLDFGPRFEVGLLDVEPPEVVNDAAYAVLVPATDEDGNDRCGVRAPMVEAPLGTYTGWNLRARGRGHGAMHTFTGSYAPFSDTESERQTTGDPRRSVQARYATGQDYVDAATAAARRLVEARLMLEEDVERVATAAADWGRPRHDVRL